MSRHGRRAPAPPPPRSVKRSSTVTSSYEDQRAIGTDSCSSSQTSNVIDSLDDVAIRQHAYNRYYAQLQGKPKPLQKRYAQVSRPIAGYNDSSSSYDGEGDEGPNRGGGGGEEGEGEGEEDDGLGPPEEGDDHVEEECMGDEECSELMGIFGWYPDWLQCYRTPEALLFWLCCATFLQGMVVNGLVNVIITTIERRFQLRSTESGMVASFYDIGYFMFAFPISFYGSSKNVRKPLWIGIGVLIMGLGSLVFSLPHFLAPAMMSGLAESNSLCHVGGLQAEQACQGATETFFASFKYVFYLGQFLHGMGATPLYTLGVTLIDDIVSTESSPVYIGIFYAMAVIGPAAGFFIGGESLKQHSRLTLKVAELGISPGSNVWVGAWWVGFLIAAIVAVFVSIPIMLFPCKMPGVDKLKREKEKEGRTAPIVEGMERASDKLEIQLSDIPCHILLLVKNPTFVALTMAAAAESGLMAGLAVFLPKFIENQFSLQASMAALLVGSLTVPAGGGGTFLGGYLVRKLKLNICGMIRLCLFAAFASALLSFVFILDCPNVEMSGKTVGYSNTNNISHRIPLHNLTAECNDDCGCNEYRYEPICGADGFMYYSPCHAGCLVERRDTSFVKVFMDCRCLTGFTFRTRTYAGRQWNVQAIGKICDNHCPYLNIYIIFCIAFAYLTLIDSVPSMSATLRVVPEKQRSLALGLQMMYIKLFGTIPAPVIFGKFFDSTCRLWQKPCPMMGSHGNCRFYDNYWMSRYMLLSALTGKTMTFVYYSMAYYSYKTPDGKPCFDWEKGKQCAVSADFDSADDEGAEGDIGGEDADTVSSFESAGTAPKKSSRK